MLRRLIDGVGDQGFVADRAVQKSRGDVCSLARDGIAAMKLTPDRACDHFACGDAHMYSERRR